MATSFSGGRSRFSNISAISWRPVLVVEEAEYPERTTDPGQATGKLYHLCSCESTAPYLERTTDHGQATVKLYHLRLRVECTLGKQLVNFITCGCELSAPFQATGKLYHLRLRVECTL